MYHLKILLYVTCIDQICIYCIVGELKLFIRESINNWHCKTTFFDWSSRNYVFGLIGLDFSNNSTLMHIDFCSREFSARVTWSVSSQVCFVSLFDYEDNTWLVHEDNSPMVGNSALGVTWKVCSQASSWTAMLWFISWYMKSLLSNLQAITLC